MPLFIAQAISREFAKADRKLCDTLAFLSLQDSEPLCLSPLDVSPPQPAPPHLAAA